MAFSEQTIMEAWKKAKGRCECTRLSHGHTIPCNKELVWENHGRETGRGAWEAHHIVSGGGDTLSNCQILCWDCHKETL